VHEGSVDDTIEDFLIAGRYRLQRSMGRGGLRATDQELGTTVVLERLPPDALPQARVAATVRHPHLVAILDVVEEPDVLWLVSEDVPARSLAELVGEYGAMSTAAAAHIGAQVATGLAAAHAAGVVHGALTPDRILVADAGTAPVAKISGLGSSPATDTHLDVSALGAALEAAVGGRPGEPLAALVRELTDDDPDVRPTAEEAHVALARLAAPVAGPAPQDQPPRRRWVRIVGAAAVVIAAVVAVLATLVFVPSVPPITPADERTLDPCSLIDVAALAPFGKATIRPGYGAFSECTAVIPAGDEDVHVNVDLMTGDTARAIDPSIRDPFDPITVPDHASDGYCNRYVHLPDGHAIRVSATRYGSTYRTDYCALADMAARTVIERLVAGRFAPRSSDADRSALAGIRACDLLDQESVTAAVTAAHGNPPVGPINGNAGWYCDWEPVWLTFMRESSPGAPEFYGDPVTIGGRPGMTRTDGDDVHCRAYIPQRYFLAEDGRMRAEYVRIHLQGTADPATICRAAVDLAERVASRLPPFG
jgi:eukaryotic-like serine/threonine-protein kinase